MNLTNALMNSTCMNNFRKGGPSYQRATPQNDFIMDKIPTISAPHTVTLYSGDYLQQPYNCLFPHRFDISLNNEGKSNCLKILIKDYVGVKYKDNYRRKENFEMSNCVLLDLDNSHSEKQEDWRWIEDVCNVFPEVAFVVHCSRNHWKHKGEKAARPRGHFIFPITPNKQ